MRPLLRTLGVAVLAAALLNASAGLCFCHRGPVLPGSESSSAGCCHGLDTTGTTVVKAVSSCCQIESTESAATPSATAQWAPPAAVFTPVVLAASLADSLPVVAAALAGYSPPPPVLRI